MSFALTLLSVALAMAAQDAFGTLMMVAEVRGREKLAGYLDAAKDGAVFVGNVYGAGTAIKYGWTPEAFATLAVMMLVSNYGTRYWTRLSRRIEGDASVAPEKT